MPETIGSRLKKAWNVFFNKDPTADFTNVGSGYSWYPNSTRRRPGNERSIVNSVLNRIAVDAAMIDIHHVRLDENGRYISTIDSGLDECLNVMANIDQTGRAFVQDMVMSMIDEGHVAIVPVDTNSDPINGNSYDILTMRTGKVISWYTNSVQVDLYNDRTGNHEQITLPKKMVAIAVNPFYTVMNEPNSTLQRLIRKLNILDAIDEQSGSGKLNMIVQLPYIVKTSAQKEQAEVRRKSIEDQLANSKFGIAYTDGTEHVTQLNRPLENNLMSQIEYLTSMLYSQLGITKEILEGSANDATMLNYNSRIIEPILSAIVDAMIGTFLTRTARTQHQSIMFFRDPFRLVPVNQLADIADKMTRNEIMTSNEIRQVIGMKPSEDPNADILRNKNINQSAEQTEAEVSNLVNGLAGDGEEKIQNGNPEV